MSGRILRRRPRPRRPGIRTRLTVAFAGSLVAGTLLVLVGVLVTVDSVAARQSLVLDGTTPETGDAAADETAMEETKQAAIERQERFTERLRDALLMPVAVRGLWLVALVGVAGLGLGWLWAGAATRPMARVAARARRLAGRGLHERLENGPPEDEVHDLVETFNDMLSRLEAAVDSQWRFLANTSHELRTPLAINRTVLEVAMARRDAPDEVRRLGETLLTVNARHEHIIDGLLTLARSEHRVIRPVPVDLAEVLDRCARLVHDDAARAGVSVRLRADPALVPGDPAMLERLVHNLLENAVRYNVDDGWVEAWTRQDAARCTLQVTNSGPVVPPYATATLFEAFHRSDLRDGSAPPGLGLGLSIVRSVARAHGGDASSAARPEGGLILTIELPASVTQTSGAHL